MLDCYDESIEIHEAESLPYGGVYRGHDGALKHSLAWVEAWGRFQTAEESRMDPVIRQVVERFLAASSSGDVQSLMDVLAPDVVFLADGGGYARTARRPIEGGKPVAALLTGLFRLAPDAQPRSVWLNGEPGVRVDLAGKLDTVATFAIENGRITRIFMIRNPHKLGWLETPVPLIRA